MADNLPQMEYRHLGNSGLLVSVISLGGWLTYGGHVEDGKSCCSLIGYLFMSVNCMRSNNFQKKHLIA